MSGVVYEHHEYGRLIRIRVIPGELSSTDYSISDRRIPGILYPEYPVETIIEFHFLKDDYIHIYNHATLGGEFTVPWKDIDWETVFKEWSKNLQEMFVADVETREIISLFQIGKHKFRLSFVSVVNGLG